MFKSKLFKVAYAIIIAEGWKPRLYEGATDGTASYINHNPGNLRSSPFQLAEAPNQFSIFENDLVGFYAVAWQLWAYARGHNPLVPPKDTILDAIATYTALPYGSQDLENYITIIEKVGGVSRTDPIGSILN